MNNRIIGCISIFAGLGLVLLFKNRLEKRSECLSLELTLKIAQEIKYHMIVLCIDFARKVDKQFKKVLKPAEMGKINQKLKQSMQEFYSQKQQLILGKYQVEKQLYKQSFMYYEKEAQLQRIWKEIGLMMENAIQGDGPSLTVPQQASRHLNYSQAIEVFRQLLENIVLLVWKQVIAFTQNDPTFNPKDELHFKKVLQKLKIYDAKVEFLVQKGYLKEWGCPNQTFLKIIQNYKNSPDLNLKIKEIESTYEQSIDNIQDNPFSLTEQGIKGVFRKITFQQKQYK